MASSHASEEPRVHGDDEHLDGLEAPPPSVCPGGERDGGGGQGGRGEVGREAALAGTDAGAELGEDLVKDLEDEDRLLESHVELVEGLEDLVVHVDEEVTHLAPLLQPRADLGRHAHHESQGLVDRRRDLLPRRLLPHLDRQNGARLPQLVLIDHLPEGLERELLVLVEDLLCRQLLLGQPHGVDEASVELVAHVGAPQGAHDAREAVELLEVEHVEPALERLDPVARQEYDVQVLAGELHGKEEDLVNHRQDCLRHPFARSLGGLLFKRHLLLDVAQDALEVVELPPHARHGHFCLLSNVLQLPEDRLVERLSQKLPHDILVKRVVLRYQRAELLRRQVEVELSLVLLRLGEVRRHPLAHLVLLLALLHVEELRGPPPVPQVAAELVKGGAAKEGRVEGWLSLTSHLSRGCAVDPGAEDDRVHRRCVRHHA
mmetsp:Transcript_20659/g.51733  ORF Transcript_20659/g.51733 Transcript_20659/m.51733 type:complete len:432 (-) Transcript_20659:56-1351(-)